MVFIYFILWAIGGHRWLVGVGGFLVVVYVKKMFIEYWVAIVLILAIVDLSTT